MTYEEAALIVLAEYPEVETKDLFVQLVEMIMKRGY